VVDALVLFAVVVLGVVFVASALLAYASPLSLRIAFRNIRRARSRTVLVVLGLLVGTAIVSGSLVVGDTVSTVDLHYSYLAYGYTDESIYGTSTGGGYLYFPASVAAAVANGSAGDGQIAGVTPEIVDSVQLFDVTTHIPQTNLNLVGSPASAVGPLGPFASTSGGNPGTPSGTSIFLDRLAAEDVNASVGDTVRLYGATTLTATVGAIVVDDTRGGFFTAGVSGGTVFVDLATAQALENASGKVNYIAVTNAGSLAGGVGLSGAVSASLNRTLASVPGTSALAVYPTLQNAVSAATSASASLSSIFLVFGLFSIVAGAMLIIGIFAMIAEERKGEMGMLRAVGLQRRVLVLAYYFEGLVYSVGSALAGTLVGVATGFILLYAYIHIVPTTGLDTATLESSFTVTGSTLLVSYLVGFLLTLATVAIAAWRVSRLNIIRAIRDVPEPPPALKTYTYLAYLGAAALVLGLLLYATTYSGTGDVSYPVIGGALAILGAGLVLSRFVRNRIAFSAVGIGLLLWAGLEPLQNALLGSGHSGGIFYVFVDGILLVGGALLLAAFNGPTLARAVERLFAGRSGATPVTRVGLAYPTRRAARTSINLAIFALVLFVIVLLALYSATLTGNLDNSLESQSGGYTFAGSSVRPIPDLPGQIANNSSLAGLFSTVVPVVIGTAYAEVPGSGFPAYTENVVSPPTNASPANNFYDTEAFPFTATEHGMSAAAAFAALRTNGSVALVDGNYASGGGGFTSGPHPKLAPGATIVVANPTTGVARNLTVIGILTESVVSGVWVNPTTATALGYTALDGYLLTVHPGVSKTLAAQKLKAAYYPYGLTLIDFESILAETSTIISGDIGLLEVFIALGLAVGIAALGILALRAVTERRHEIGMLRATGLTRGMILRAFLAEYTYVTVLGAAIGGSLALLVVYNLVISPGASAAGVTALYIPWLNLVLVLLVTGALATLAVIGPSLRAARLPPAEAIRTLE
jgi:putative ABC transport system permease protein